jgi:hypothetical protein
MLNNLLILKKKHHTNTKTVEEWENFLLERYGYGIFEFSYCIARMISDADPRYSFARKELPNILRRGRSKYYEEIKSDLKRKKKLKDYIINKLSYFLKLVGQLGEGKITEKESRFIIEIYGLEPLLEKIDREICFHEESLMMKSIWRRRGPLFKTRYKVASIFAQIIKNNRGPNWVEIEDLLWWFYDNLRDATYCKEFGTKDEDFVYYHLKNEYYVIRSNEKRRKDIEYSREIFFPVPRKRKPFRIEFNEDYININTEDNRFPLISFPNRVTFP